LFIFFVQAAEDKAHGAEIAAAVAKAVGDERAAAAKKASAEKVCGPLQSPITQITSNHSQRPASSLLARREALQ